MTTKKKKRSDEIIVLLGTGIGRAVIRLWFVKKALTHLTGKEHGWKSAYCLMILAQVAGVYLEVGRQQQDEFSDRVQTLKLR